MTRCSRSGNGLPRRRRKVGVILAGGVGSRMNLDIPKQFVPVAGRTSLEHSAAVFQGCDCIDEILVMIEPDSIARAREPFHAREPARDVTVLPLQGLSVNGRELPGPAKPEQMLAAIYGPGWRTPDPAFRFNTPAPARRRFHGWLNGYDADRENREDRHRTEIAADLEASPSAWAQQLAPDLSRGSRILELGCGVGVDARHLADQGHHVLAVDYSRPALHAAGGSPHRRLVLRRTNLASTRESVALAGAVPVTGPPLHVYARLLLNALDPSGQDCTLTLLRHVLRAYGSGRAFLEIEPGPIPGLYAGWSNYRRVDPARLRQELNDKGLEIEDSADYFGGAEDGCHHLQLRVKARTP